MQENTKETTSVLVSVVVPIYNPGALLERCLRSLCAQTLHAMEIVCVLDCPTDGSDRVVEQYAQSDSRVRVIQNSRNMGVGGSRDIGIQAARGEYIGFSDDDDYVEGATYYEDLYRAAQTQQADVVISAVAIDRAEGTTIMPVSKTDTYTHLQSILYPEQTRLVQEPLARSVWHSLYRRVFLQDHSVRFYDRRTHLEEDTLFNVQVFTQTEHVAIVPQAYYHWDLTRSTRNESNYRSTYDIHAVHRFFTMVKQSVKASPLLTHKQQNTLLADCLSGLFYTRYCALRNIDPQTIADTLGEDLQYICIRNVIHVCYTSPKQILRHGPMLLKFYHYIHSLRQQI